MLHQSLNDCKTIGDVINFLAASPQIDLYTLEQAIKRRCQLPGYSLLTVDGQLTHKTPGGQAEKAKRAEQLETIDKLLAETRQ